MLCHRASGMLCTSVNKWRVAYFLSAVLSAECTCIKFLSHSVVDCCFLCASKIVCFLPVNFCVCVFFLCSLSSAIWNNPASQCWCLPSVQSLICWAQWASSKVCLLFARSATCWVQWMMKICARTAGSRWPTCHPHCWLLTSCPLLWSPSKR